MVIFLNNVQEGGELSFKNIDKQFRAVKGDAVIWKNTYHNGKENPYTKHVHLPVIDGEKTTLTKYFRDGVIVVDAHLVDGEAITVNIDEVK